MAAAATAAAPSPGERQPLVADDADANSNSIYDPQQPDQRSKRRSAVVFAAAALLLLLGLWATTGFAVPAASVPAARAPVGAAVSRDRLRRRPHLLAVIADGELASACALCMVLWSLVSPQTDSDSPPFDSFTQTSAGMTSAASMATP